MTWASTRQRRIEIMTYLTLHTGPVPSRDELCTRFGVSTKTMTSDLDALESLGYLDRGHNRARAITVMVPFYPYLPVIRRTRSERHDGPNPHP